MIENKEMCEICGRNKKEYNKEWECKKNHDWRSSWRKDKTTKHYERYLKRRKKSQSAAQRRKLEKLNKRPPKEYEKREKKKGAWKWWRPTEV